MVSHSSSDSETAFDQENALPWIGYGLFSSVFVSMEC